MEVAKHSSAEFKKDKNRWKIGEEKLPEREGTIPESQATALHIKLFFRTLLYYCQVSFGSPPAGRVET